AVVDQTSEDTLAVVRILERARNGNAVDALLAAQRQAVLWIEHAARIIWKAGDHGDVVAARGHGARELARFGNGLGIVVLREDEELHAQRTMVAARYPRMIFATVRETSS